MATRRDFLKGVLASGAAATACVASSPAAARETRPIPGEALGLLYDGTLCVGCKACVAACKTANENPAEFSLADKLWDTPLDTSGYTFNIIKMYRNGTMDAKDQEVNGFAFMKTSCMHCGDPSCVSACPVSAMTKNPVTGVVGYNPDKCIGCRYCVAACPFGIPKYQYDSPTGRIGKCELCRHRHEEGHYSACAEVCPTGATLFGRTEDLLAEAKRRLAMKPGEMNRFPRGHLLSAQDKKAQVTAYAKGVKMRNGWREEPDQTYETQAGKYLQHVYGEKEYGGTQVLKLSGVNFQKMGMPDLPPDAAAAMSETIQHSLYGGLLMPFAVLGAMTYVAKRNVKPEDDESGKEGS
jgi:Fe-S-cluster-containing dehydrogenase component